MSDNQQSKKKILILGNSHLVVFRFRGELIEELIRQDYDVWVCFPNGPFGEGQKTADEYGCHFIENHIDRRGKNPLKDLSLMKEYGVIIDQIKPDAVLAYTVKPDVYGGMACRRLKVPFIPNITGLGKGLAEGGMVQKLTVSLYKKAVKRAECVFFQNESDMAFFDTHGIRYPHDELLPGSGVNLKKFVPLDYPGDDGKIRFIYVARVMKAKGIEQFFDAAHALRQKYPQTEFHICGYCEEDYKELLAGKEKSGEIIYHGLVEDVREYEKDCHCIVLPTFHPEGVSNVLLEGAACARPLITTDRPGCRETVEDGVTGYLVRERDSQDLIEKMEKFIQLSNAQRRQMGLAGRAKIEKEFDRQIVVDAYMRVLNDENKSISSKN